MFFDVILAYIIYSMLHIKYINYVYLHRWCGGSNEEACLAHSLLITLALSGFETVLYVTMLVAFWGTTVHRLSFIVSFQ